jgi:hypothetical protein
MIDDPSESAGSDPLDAYLDGTMDPVEQEAFARGLEDDRARSDEVKLDQRIGRSLRELFAAPEPLDADQMLTELRRAAGSVQAAPAASRSPTRRRLYWTVVVATAAAVAWAAVAWQLLERTAPEVAFAERPLHEVYSRAIAEGFQPYWECEDDEQFRAVFLERQGESLRLDPLPDGSRMLGLAYLGGLSPMTTAMLAEVGADRVVVFADRVERDVPQPPPPAASGLHLFRKVLGPLVLYEVTPLDSPQVFDALRLSSHGR